MQVKLAVSDRFTLRSHIFSSKTINKPVAKQLSHRKIFVFLFFFSRMTKQRKQTLVDSLVSLEGLVIFLYVNKHRVNAKLAQILSFFFFRRKRWTTNSLKNSLRHRVR